MVNSYISPQYNRGSPNIDAANTSNVVVTGSDIKKGGGSFVYSGPSSNPTTTATNYSPVTTSQQLAGHSQNAKIQAQGDSLTGGKKSKRRKNKRKRKQSRKRKSKRRRNFYSL
jgi:hypothetical protein